MVLDAIALARALGGIVVGPTSVLAPGPGHRLTDRSLSIKIDRNSAEGFILHSFAGDCALACRDHVRAALGPEGKLNKSAPLPRALSKVNAPADLSIDTAAFALRLWHEARDPRGTLVIDHLTSRHLTLPDDLAGSVVRFHSGLKYNGGIVAGMVTLFRDIHSNAPCGIHRTFLNAAGQKLGRAMLGRVKYAAMKIDADENVTIGLTVGEGFETCLAARLAGFRPVWAAGSAGSIANFPLLAGVEALTVLGEVGDGGANCRATGVCANRWTRAGKEAFIATPLVGDDLNDVWREVEP